MKRTIIFLFTIFCVCLSGCGANKANKENIVLMTESPKEKATEQNTIESEENNSAEVFDEEFSVYNNPIDRWFMSIIDSEESCEAEIRAAQDDYKELWIQEFENLMKTLHKKCVYDKDKKNIDIFEKRIKSEIEMEIEIITTELMDAYEVNPDTNDNDNISRISLWGNGTRSRLNQIEGEIYRDASMRIIDVYGSMSGEKYEFRKSDYSFNEKSIGEAENVSIEIKDKRMDVNGHSISVPLISGDKADVKNINKLIIEKIKQYIDQESDLLDFNYIVKHNDGRYVSIILEIMQYKKSLPHPGKQAHAINIDIKEKKILDNNDLVSDKKSFCEDIKKGRYILLSENEISNNIPDSSKYIENKKIEEIEDMFGNKELEIFMSNQSLGFIAIVPYAIGNYAVFEK